MRVASVEAVARALNEARVPFLVVGGLAVNAHGYGRATHDMDIVVPLNPDDVRRLFEALGGLGYRPLVPVTAAEFGDAATRSRLIGEKGMLVLQFHSVLHKEMRVDVFVSEPFDFEIERAGAYVDDVAPGVPVPFASLPTMIKMKEAAGRPRDLDDAQHLRWIAEDFEHRS